MDLWRFGKEIKGEIGGMSMFLASLWICGTAAFSIAARAGRGAASLWRWLAGKAVQAEEDDTWNEGA